MFRRVIKTSLSIALLTLLLGNSAYSQRQRRPAKPSAKPFTTIAFGSCNRQNRPQPLWQPILQHQPQLWIWLGDNIYGDTDSMEVLNDKYTLQLQNPDYQQLRRQVPIIGIWDDHDYGRNDAGKDYAYRAESQSIMCDFLDVPPDAPQRTHPGAYASHTYGPAGKQVKVLLLDGRYFRDALMRDSTRAYLPNLTGDMLGEAQWAWLEEELRSSTAQVHIIGCGIQFLPEEHVYEKWANFPAAKARLLQLIVDSKQPNVILLSGDRHIAEISRVMLPGRAQPLYEVTSSGLTHTWGQVREEPNRHRIGALIAKLNFGVITIDWAQPGPDITLEVRGEGDALYLQQTIEKP
jgi:alkaline phosphatase D